MSDVQPLILASASPRRRELLVLLEAPLGSREAAIDEATAAAPARAKARAVTARGSTVLAADTRIRLDDTDIGKPADATEAVQMLLRLAAKTHVVVTDVVVVDAAGRETEFAVLSRVRMRAFGRAEAAAYVATGESLDAAGGYKVQGEGARLVESVEGCFANVIGLPLCHVYEALRGAGRAFPQRPERVCQLRFAFLCPVWRHAQAQGRALRDGETYASWREGGDSLVRVGAT